MKSDIATILRECERFGVKVEKGKNLNGVTMNGKPFDVTDVMEEALMAEDLRIEGNEYE